MSKFHLGDDGQPRPCTAGTMACPKGGEQNHFEGGIQDARSWAEERNEELAGDMSEIPSHEKSLSSTDKYEKVIQEDTDAAIQEYNQTQSAHPSNNETDDRALYDGAVAIYGKSLERSGKAGTTYGKTKN